MPKRAPIPASILEMLLASPETVHVTIGGVERPFLLSVYGCEIAAAAGHDPVPALADLIGSALPAAKTAMGDGAQSIASEIAGRINGGSLSALATVVWAGLLPFDRDLATTDGLTLVKATLTPGTLMGLVVRVLPAVTAFARDGLSLGAADGGPDGAPEGGGAGKPQPGRSRRAPSGEASTASAG